MKLFQKLPRWSYNEPAHTPVLDQTLAHAQHDCSVAHAAPDAGLALDVRDVHAAYDRAGARALCGVSMQLGKGKRVALVGPNGAGKSTLLKVIAGVLRPASGRVTVYGLRAGACHHIVSYLSQRGEVDWRFPISVRRLVLGGRYVHLGWFHRPRAADYQIVAQVLERMGIAALADRQISELSGGQQQRALLARALAQQARLLLMDEPMNAVDRDTRAILTEVLDEVQQQGASIVIATHDHGRLDREFDEVVYLYEGRRVEGTPASEHQHGDDCRHDHEGGPAYLPLSGATVPLALPLKPAARLLAAPGASAAKAASADELRPSTEPPEGRRASSP